MKVGYGLSKEELGANPNEPLLEKLVVVDQTLTSTNFMNALVWFGAVKSENESFAIEPKTYPFDILTFYCEEDVTL